VSKKELVDNDNKEIQYYSGSQIFIDGQQWENRQKKLIPKNDLGSIIDPRES
jgi:hypothetical protein